MDISVFARSEPGVSTYAPQELAGVAALVAAGVVSCVAVVPVLVVTKWRCHHLRNTRVVPFLVSLLIANLVQAIGTLINGKWVTDHTVADGHLCRTQGGIKQAGNVATALWSLTLSLHVFMLLFSRVALSRNLSWGLLGSGWCLVVFVVIIGPAAIQTPSRGTYFGPAGYWCWITERYPREQFFLEYFFEFVSAGLSLLLYTAVLLRVRGNLVRTSGRWHVRFVPHGERYPVAYAILLLPVTITRFVAFSGHDVPFRATIFSDFVFNLQGLVNVVLLLATNRFVPNTEALPIYTPRKRVSISSPEAIGITPFVLPPPKALTTEGAGIFTSAPDAIRQGAAAETVSAPKRPASDSTLGTVDSQTPFPHLRSN